jgi:hypothetical protein
MYYSRLSLYSDNKEINLESGNILSLSTEIEYKFSKFSSNNKITKLNLQKIFKKYNPFKINIFNPFQFYFEGMQSMIDGRELNSLLEINPLEKNDYRFQITTKKLFNINTLEEACEILQTLLGGSTVIYDDYEKKYRSYSTLINFSNANGLSNDYIYLSDENVYKTFSIS